MSIEETSIEESTVALPIVMFAPGATERFSIFKSKTEDIESVSPNVKPPVNGDKQLR